MRSVGFVAGQKQRGHTDRRRWLLLAGTAVTLVLAALVKGPCLSQPWNGSQYRNLCYNDLQPLYAIRGLDEKVVPYVGTEGVDADGAPKGFLEYPVLTGIILFLAAIPSSTNQEFFLWNAAILSLFALATTMVLISATNDPRRVAFFAAGPPLILYAFHNWDLIPVFFATLGLVAFGRGRWMLSGAALGLGAAAKVYPALFVPILGLALLRDEAPRFGRTVRLVGSSVVAFVAVNLPFVIVNPFLWWKTYSFHLSRGFTFESPWHVLLILLRRMGGVELGFDEVRLLHAVVSIPVFLGLFSYAAWLVWRRRLPAVSACLAALIVFLLANKVWSVQYLLWVLPFFAILRIDWKKFAAIETSDVAVYATIFPYLLHVGTTEEVASFNRLAIEVLARTGFLAWLLVATFRVRSARRPSQLEARAAAVGRASDSNAPT